MGIIKANAYGHGAVAVSHMLNKVNGIDFFGVATLNEGIEVRATGLAPSDARVLVLGASTHSEWQAYSEYGLEVMINSSETLENIINWATEQKRAGALKHPMRVGHAFYHNIH